MILLYLMLLFQVVTSAVYYVRPDSDNHHDHKTLQYYQRTGKLSSNTQLYFMPGLFSLSTPLIISNISNFSLIGSSSGPTTISCNKKKAGVLISYTDTIAIKNIAIKYCGYIFNTQYRWKSKSIISNLMIVMCRDVLIERSTFQSKSKQGLLSIHDPIGSSKLHKVRSNAILVDIHSVTDDANLTITEFCDILPTDGYAVFFFVDNHSKKINVLMSQITISSHKAIKIHSNTCTGTNIFTIYQLQQKSSRWPARSVEAVILLYSVVSCLSIPKQKNLSTLVELKNCEISNINKDAIILGIYTQQTTYPRYPILVYIINSTFYNLTNTTHIVYGRTLIPSKRKPLVVLFLKNSTFKHINSLHVIDFIDIPVMIQGRTYFTNITCTALNGCIKTSNEIISFQNYTEFSFIKSHVFLKVERMILEWNTIVNFTSNKFETGIMTPDTARKRHCVFQYMNNQKVYTKHDYLIVFRNNFGGKLFSNRHSTSHCTWTEGSVFMTLDPLVINKQLIKYVNNSFNVNNITNHICLCTDSMNYDCSVDELEPIYPGQKYSLRLIVKSGSLKALSFRLDEMPITSCKTQTGLNWYNVFHNSCTTVGINIHFKDRNSCELFLWERPVPTFIARSEFGVLVHDDLADAYHISMIPCPTGFVLDVVEGICLCDPLLQGTVVFITDCNINDQTILRPTNSWISAHTVNNSHTYDVSLECPFDYCILHQSYINLATPNLQCQFNRCGILCGHCPPGYSAVFGSSQCKRCSNVYLLTIIPIAIAGIVLVLLLFLLNLTVTDGSITPFIYYVNIISINSAVFFPQRNSLYTQFTYAFVSIANLDLGIEMCFYDGMTGYAKMFLQLLFPFYLISIAVLLIIASRYSTRVQQLTARRALPVLATLFLLSYTKILQTVCIVLFFFSSSTHLPNKQTTTVWSVDTSVILFEVKFVFLFIACLILFVVLMVFNLVLVFIRPLSCFKFITHFKPLLDAYQGPYKDKFYFWIGLQLVTRAMFFGLSASEKHIDLFLGSLLLCIVAGMHGQVHPFIRKEKNIQEFLFLLSLQRLFLVKLFAATNTAFVDALISIAILHFGVILTLQVKAKMLKKVQANELLSMFSLKCKLLCKVKSAEVECIELSSEIPERSIYNKFQEPLLEHF